MSEFSRRGSHEAWAEIIIERTDRRNSLIPLLAGEIRGYLEQLNKNDNTFSNTHLRLPMSLSLSISWASVS